MDDVPEGVPNYFYAESTGNGKLRRHLRKQHPEEYDLAIETHKWDYKPTTQSNDALDNEIPPFSKETFLEYLARFVVASDQVRFTDFGLFHALTHLQVDSCRRKPGVPTDVHDTPRIPHRRRLP